MGKWITNQRVGPQGDLPLSRGNTPSDCQENESQTSADSATPADAGAPLSDTPSAFRRRIEDRIREGAPARAPGRPASSPGGSRGANPACSPSRLEETFERAETEWQRQVLREWGRRNAKPAQIMAGCLGAIDVVPTLCICSRCETPAVIIPDQEIVPARGFVLCPQCSMQQVTVSDRTT